MHQPPGELEGTLDLVQSILTLHTQALCERTQGHTADPSEPVTRREGPGAAASCFPRPGECRPRESRPHPRSRSAQSSGSQRPGSHPPKRRTEQGGIAQRVPPPPWWRPTSASGRAAFLPPVVTALHPPAADLRPRLNPQRPGAAPQRRPE